MSSEHERTLYFSSDEEQNPINEVIRCMNIESPSTSGAVSETETESSGYIPPSSTTDSSDVEIVGVKRIDLTLTELKTREKKNKKKEMKDYKDFPAKKDIVVRIPQDAFDKYLNRVMNEEGGKGQLNIHLTLPITVRRIKKE